MAYNTIEDDDYIRKKTEMISKQIELLVNGLTRFEKVLDILTSEGITEGVTNSALRTYKRQVSTIKQKLSGVEGLAGYSSQIPDHANNFIDEVRTAGDYLYD